MCNLGLNKLHAANLLIGNKNKFKNVLKNSMPNLYIKIRRPASAETDNFYCLEAPGSPWLQATGFRGFQAAKMISFCTEGTP